jgi:hypothetical protein
VTPSALTLPSFIWPMTVGVLKKPIDTSPVMTASTPCGALVGNVHEIGSRELAEQHAGQVMAGAGAA